MPEAYLALKVWGKISPAQQVAVQAAATDAATANQEARLADEQSVATNLKMRGLQLDSLDLTPFRALADKMYAGSAKSWDATWHKRVEAAA